jgi:hypothetical protein
VRAVPDVYALSLTAHLEPGTAGLEGLGTDLPGDWMALHRFDEETGALHVVMAGVTPLGSAGTVAELKLRMTDATAQMSIDGEATLNENGAAALGSVQVRQVPTEFALRQNYPNPFNPTTQIAFSLPEDARVLLEVYDVAGRLVQTLMSRDQAAGVYRVQWDGRNQAGQPVASGIYLYRLQAGSSMETRTMMLLK